MIRADFLRATDLIDYTHPTIAGLARTLAEGLVSDVDIARACFLFVRDSIRHSSDYQLNPVTCRASDVLAHGTGYCFAKSHLLAALLRANGIPAGFCYQRLSIDEAGPPYTLHGFNAIHLTAHGWYRADARGCKPGVTSDFVPPREALAYATRLDGEADLPEIWPDPLPVVVQALTAAATWQDVLAGLPDIELTGGRLRA